ncbi:MAG: hypothetical protein QNL63_14155, partial [Paracoccaceae bacterium]
ACTITLGQKNALASHETTAQTQTGNCLRHSYTTPGDVTCNKYFFAFTPLRPNAKKPGTEAPIRAHYA